MEFSMKEWTRMYRLAHEIGKTLRDSRPTFTDLGSYIAPVLALSEENQKVLENKIQSITQRSNKYLDQCGVRPKRPLWHYDKNNPETHPSAPQFKFDHLLEDMAWPA